MPKLIQYREKCIGCGICAEMQPHLWRMSMKDGKATLVKAIEKKQVLIRSISEADKETATMVVKACPVNIIQLRF